MFGVFVVYTGYPAAFALTGMLMLASALSSPRPSVTPLSRRVLPSPAQ